MHDLDIVFARTLLEDNHLNLGTLGRFGLFLKPGAFLIVTTPIKSCSQHGISKVLVLQACEREKGYNM